MIKFTYTEIQVIKRLLFERQEEILKFYRKQYKNTPISAETLVSLPYADDKDYDWKLEQLATSMHEENVVAVSLRRIQDLDDEIKGALGKSAKRGKLKLKERRT